MLKGTRRDWKHHCEDYKNWAGIRHRAQAQLLWDLWIWFHARPKAKTLAIRGQPQSSLCWKDGVALLYARQNGERVAWATREKVCKSDRRLQGRPKKLLADEEIIIWYATRLEACLRPAGLICELQVLGQPSLWSVDPRTAKCLLKTQLDSLELTPPPAAELAAISTRNGVRWWASSDLGNHEEPGQLKPISRDGNSGQQDLNESREASSAAIPAAYRCQNNIDKIQGVQSP